MFKSKKNPKHVKENKPWNSFLILSFFILLSLFLSLIIFVSIFINPSITIYNIIEFIFITLNVILILLITSIIIALSKVYYNTSINPVSYFLTWMGFHFLFPVLIILSKNNKDYKASILLLYVQLNNIIVKMQNKKYKPDEILILLPHCLQNSLCPHKITGFISNCRKCLKCKIGNIKMLTEKYNIKAVEVVTGGSAARSVVTRNNPKIIIAVACERDLASGIGDIKNIPIIGLLNSRPYGPCINTQLGMEEFSEALDGLLIK